MDDHLPMLQKPHDALRHGLTNLKDQAIGCHPVENIQNHLNAEAPMNKLRMTQNLYGAGLPARMHIQQQMLSKCGRLPGLPSSRLGLESLTGALDDFTTSSYLGLYDQSEVGVPDLHAQMEVRLKMADVTKPSMRDLH